jgi:hypothetical protein
MFNHIIRSLGSTCLPHDNPKTVCPPGEAPTGQHPPIIVASLMRCGTHLTIDLLLNNLQPYRNKPLYVDFDRHVFEARDPAELMAAGSCIIKTHIQQRPFNQATLDLLKEIAAKGLVIIPVRKPSDTRSSLLQLNYLHSEDRLMRDHEQHVRFWSDFSPIFVDFSTLLDLEKASLFLKEVRCRLGLSEPEHAAQPIIASRSEWRVFWDKFQTRLLGARAKLINTTIGFKVPKTRVCYAVAEALTPVIWCWNQTG